MDPLGWVAERAEVGEFGDAPSLSAAAMALRLHVGTAAFV